MAIVFAENFQNDNLTSIMTRYPGTNRPLPATYTDPTRFPLDTNSYFVINAPTTGFNKVEIYLTFDNTSAGTNTTTVLNLFGITLQTPNATTLAINGNTVTSGTTLSGITYLHLVFINDAGQWTGYVFADNGLKETFTAGIFQWSASMFQTAPSTFLPKQITSIVVAHDTPVGTRMNNITWNNGVLTSDNQGTWTYSDVGYVQDTDKSDPSVVDPYIATTTDAGVISFTTTAFDSVNWHVAGRTDNIDESILDLNDNADSYRLLNGVKGRAVTASSLDLKVREPVLPVVALPNFENMAKSALTATAANSIAANIDDYAVNAWTPMDVGFLPYWDDGPFGTKAPVIHSRTVANTSRAIATNLSSDFGLQPFTLELWVSGNGHPGFGHITNLVSIPGLALLHVATSVQVNNTIMSVIPNNTWTSVCLVYIPTNLKTGEAHVWMDGSKQVPVADVTITGTSITLGGVQPNARAYTATCYLRVLNGVALYDPSQTTIPVPTAPWPKP